MIPSQALKDVLAQIDADLERSLDRLFDFLRIQSISTDPAYKDAMRSAAQYVATDLTSIGFDASIRPTAGHPVVIGKLLADKMAAGRAFCSTATMTFSRSILWICGRRRRLLRGLFREPDGRKIIVARGACDDKGQVMTFIEACRAFKLVTGQMPLPITYDDRRRGGVRLESPIRLCAGACATSSSSIWRSSAIPACGIRSTPMVTTSLRGLVYEQVKITCADRDLHSGLFGGAAQNPLAGAHAYSGRHARRGWEGDHSGLL